MNWRENPDRRYRRAGQGLVFFAVSLAINWAVVLGTVELVRYRNPQSEPREELLVVDLESDGTVDQQESAEVDSLSKDRSEPVEEMEEPEKSKPKPEIERPPKPKVKEEPKPIPEPVVEAPDKLLPSLPAVPPQMKIVEQLDKHDEDLEPTDPNYLSNINRNVREETRAEITNLAKDADRPEAEAPDSTQDKEKGHSTENKIAEQDSTPAQVQQRSRSSEQSSPQRRQEKSGERSQSLLTMRRNDFDPNTVKSESPEIELSQAPDGTLSQPPKAADNDSFSKMSKDRRSKSGVLNPLRMSREQVVAQVGQNWKFQPQEGSTSESKKKGVWDDVRRHYQSPLENMVPEVKVGNQTALRSRKVPFARFIATMHRGIHEIWAYGYLEQWDTRGRRDLFADQSLWTRVEIVLLPTGAIDNVKTVHFSGNSAFDGVAREVVWSAGPYPEPPTEIRSGNGKVYMHWTFHRNERACGTFGATPYILDNAGNGDRPDPHGEIVMAPPGSTSPSTERIRRLAPKGMANNGSFGPSIPSTSNHSNPMKRGAQSKKFHGPIPQTALPFGAPNGGGGGTGTTMSDSAGMSNGESVPKASDPLAASVAHGWIGGLTKGSKQAMTLRSATPFHVGNLIAARNRKELHALFAGFVEESQGSRKGSIVLFTASDLLRKLGSLPSGVRAGENRLYAMVEFGVDSIVLVLAKRNGSWRVVGISR